MSADWPPLTIPAHRGCGHRQAGGIYACLGVSPIGKPVWDFLLDPPVPTDLEPFRGIHIWQEDQEKVVLRDWVGESFYPSVPDFIEEVRRFGLSRRIQAGFPFQKLNGKRVFLALAHIRAVPTVHDMPRARYCKKGGDEKHLRECVYGLWLRVGLETPGLREMPAFTYDPLNVFRDDDRPRLADAWWDDEGPGFFAVFPLTHFEVVEFSDAEAEVARSGMPVVRVNE